MTIGAVLCILARLPFPQRDTEEVRAFHAGLPRNQNLIATPEQVARAKELSP